MGNRLIKEGMFLDNKVSGIVFRGKLRKICAVIYRHLTTISTCFSHDRKIGKAERSQLMQQFNCNEIEAAQHIAKRMLGKEKYNSEKLAD